MNNESYLKQKKIPVETETFRELMLVLDGYGNNRWWLSENPRTRAYYQTLDETSPLIIPFWQYRADLSVLLGREVQVYETRVSNRITLRQEVKQAWDAEV
jgi:hypothetical protein